MNTIHTQPRPAARGAHTPARRERKRTPTAQHRSSTSTAVKFIGSLLLVLVALGGGFVLATRSVARAAQTGAEHSIGSVTAPVVVEEWSDFE